jgi:16S rRNA (uracil1498-N3)-methyltransferase
VTLPVFLTDADTAATAAVAKTLTLTGREGHHAADVRRLRRGDDVEVVDGRGLRLLCTVREPGRAHLLLDVAHVAREPRAVPQLTVAQALVKQEAAERALSAMTEVGVDTVVPWSAAHSVVSWDASREQRGLRRWRAAVDEAAKQSRRAWVPEVTEVADLSVLIDRVSRADLALVLDGAAERPISEVAVAAPVLTAPGTGDVLLVVGPEGGLTRSEVGALHEAGAQAVHLGPTVLRSATAGAVAAAVLLSRTARWLTRHAEAPAG